MNIKPKLKKALNCIIEMKNQEDPEKKKSTLAQYGYLCTEQELIVKTLKKLKIYREELEEELEEFQYEMEKLMDEVDERIAELTVSIKKQ